MYAKSTFPVFMGSLFRTLCYQEKFSAQTDVKYVLMLTKMLEVRPSTLLLLSWFIWMHCCCKALLVFYLCIWFFFFPMYHLTSVGESRRIWQERRESSWRFVSESTSWLSWMASKAGMNCFCKESAIMSFAVSWKKWYLSNVILSHHVLQDCFYRAAVTTLFIPKSKI